MSSSNTAGSSTVASPSPPYNTEFPLAFLMGSLFIGCVQFKMYASLHASVFLINLMYFIQQQGQIYCGLAEETKIQQKQTGERQQQRQTEQSSVKGQRMAKELDSNKNYKYHQKMMNHVKMNLFGENIFGMMYLFWVIFWQKETYIFYVPLFMGSLCKMYTLCEKFLSKKPKLLQGDQSRSQNASTSNNSSSVAINQYLLEQMALFQVKCEIFVLGYGILSIFWGGLTQTLLELVSLFVILKLKYSLNYKSQEAMKQLHFSLDNVFKGSIMRAKYQKFAHFIHDQLGSVLGGEKCCIY